MTQPSKFLHPLIPSYMELVSFDRAYSYDVGDAEF